MLGNSFRHWHELNALRVRQHITILFRKIQSASLYGLNENFDKGNR